MKISVITVCCNAQDTIEPTILSVLSQKYDNIEYVIIDGSSKDNTLEIIEKYKDRIDYYTSESDKGIYHAMSKGIKAATGDVFYFLNAGDEFYDEFVIEKVASAFKQYKSDIIFGNLYYKSSGENQKYLDIFKPDTVYKQTEIRNKLSLYDSNIHHQTVFYKKKVFKTSGLYREDINYGSDYMLNVDAIFKNNCKVRYTDLTIAKFLLGGVSTDKETAIRDYEEARNYIRGNYFYKSLKFRIYQDISHKFYEFMSKYMRSLLRIYDNDKDFKNKIDKITEKVWGWNFE